MRTLLLALVVAGCAPPPSVAPPGRPPPIGGVDGGSPGVDGGPSPEHDGIVRAEIPPPPISGGTLAIDPSGALVVASDPDHDAVAIVDLPSRSVRTIALARGDEPGRAVIDGAGRAHVVLRGAGAIADVELLGAEPPTTRAVCAAPRGIAWRASDDTLHVACLDGTLVSLPASGGPATSSRVIADDLRDVIVRGDDLVVTRFRAATLLRISTDGTIGPERAPQAVTLPPAGMRVTLDGPFEPAVAWRALPTAGGVAILHQRAFSGEFVAESGYGGFECGASIVHSAISEIADDGTVSAGPMIDRVVLGVDLAISPDGSRIVVASPANAYRREGGGDIIFAREHDDVVVFAATDLAAMPPDGGRCVPALAPPALSPLGGAAIAVAFLPDGRLVAQTRAPAMLLVEGTASGVPLAIPLASEDELADTGHALFHARTGGGIACASCHPEGGDDARTWRFADIGPRRTQTMRGGILDTAPFHWDGDMPTFRDLVQRVFLGRMGGALRSDAEADALGAWMDTMPAPRRPEAADSAAVARGDALFHDATVACATCHAGPALTSGASVDVGTGAVLQVPTLLGIAYRAPYLHDGCAATLRDRFGTCGGGDMHGHTSHLTPAQIDDLVAYLRTL